MKINSLLRAIIFGGTFLVPFLGLYVADSMFFPFITGKNFAFRIIVEIMFAAWVVLALLDRSYAPKRSFVLWIYGGLVAIMVAADIFGVSVSRSVWSNYERMEGLVAHLHFFAYFLVIGSVIKTERMWHMLLNTSLAASVIVSFYGLAQIAEKIPINQGGVRLDGTFGNAAYLAVYSVIHIFIAAYFMVRERELWKRYMYGGVMALETFILYHTATRGAIFGLLGGALLGTALIALFGREHAQLRKASFGILAALVLIIGGFFLVRNSEFVRESPVLSRFATLSIEETKGSARFMVWEMAWKGFKERPILGWGHENFNYVFNKYYNPQMYGQEQWFDRTHNVFLDWLIASGILGLAAYLGLYAAILVFVWRESRFPLSAKAVLTGLLAAYFIHNLFVFDNLVSYILFFTIAGFAHSMLTKDVPAENGETIPRDAINFVIVPALALALAFVIYRVNILPIKANMALIDTMRSENPAESLQAFKRAISYQTFGNPEIRERLLTAASTATNATAETQREYLKFAGDQMEEQLAWTPNDARHQLFMGSFLSKIGLYDEALKHINRALELSPQKQTIIIEQGAAYLSKGEREKAFESFKAAYELAPQYNDAKVIYAIGALYTGKNELAERLIQELGPEFAINDNKLLNAYAELKMYDKVLGIWQERVAREPENISYKLPYAAALFKAGRIQESIAELEKVKQLDAQYEKQMDFYIKEIRAGNDPTEN